MKWYHFGLIFLIFFGGLCIIEQQEELTARILENSSTVEQDCLVAAVNAATQIYFDRKGKEGENKLLQDTERIFFQTLSFLHTKNTDETGIDVQQNMVPILAVLDEDGYYIYSMMEGNDDGWSMKMDYMENGEIPPAFFETIQNAVMHFAEKNGKVNYLVQVQKGQAGTWEKVLSRGCVFAVYVPKMALLSEKEKNRVLYAASKMVEETYYVTSDMNCHLAFCEKLKEGNVVAEYGTVRKAAGFGAVPCPSCLAWDAWTENP